MGPDPISCRCDTGEFHNIFVPPQGGGMENNMEKLLQRYRRLVVFDTETTGLEFHKDEIIELAAAVIELRDGVPTVVEEYDELITLSPGGSVPPKIQSLTAGIMCLIK